MSIEVYNNSLVMVIRKDDTIIKVISRYTYEFGGRYIREAEQISGEAINLPKFFNKNEPTIYFPEIQKKLVEILGGGEIVEAEEDLKLYCIASSHYVYNINLYNQGEYNVLPRSEALLLEMAMHKNLKQIKNSLELRA